MADIELLIKIPEEIYKASQVIDVKYEDVVQIPLEAIANGTPLDDIKAEIEEKRDIYRHYNDDDNNIDYGVRSGLSIALKIIEKYIGEIKHDKS